MEKASEEEKQKLREGKASIAKVYREVVALEKGSNSAEEEKTSLQSEAFTDDTRAKENELALALFLRKLVEKEVFCPSCGSAMFQCTKCHKTLTELLQKKK